MSRQLLEHITPQHWESGKSGEGSGFQRTRWLQQVSDLFDRPMKNRQTAATNATALTLSGAVLSTGIGTGLILPKRYAEVTVKARVTFNVNSTGPLYLYVYRTTGAIPANGAGPNGGDVIVGGDSFWGGPTASGVNVSTAFSFLDTPLSVTTQYRYYLAVKGPNANTFNLINSSQLLVMERA